MQSNKVNNSTHHCNKCNKDFNCSRQVVSDSYSKAALPKKPICICTKWQNPNQKKMFFCNPCALEMNLPS